MAVASQPVGEAVDPGRVVPHDLFPGRRSPVLTTLGGLVIGRTGLVNRLSLHQPSLAPSPWPKATRCSSPPTRSPSRVICHLGAHRQRVSSPACSRLAPADARLRREDVHLCFRRSPSSAQT